MDKHKYYVYKLTGESFLVLKASTSSGITNYTLWNCQTKQKEIYRITVDYVNANYLEITEEQAYNPDFQKWMKLTYGRE